RFLEDFKKQGSIIFVSHDSGAITRLCDRAIWLDRGEMRLLGDAKSVTEAYLEHLYAIQQQVDMGALSSSRSAISPVAQESLIWADSRADLLQNSNLRNDLEVFRFVADGAAFGTGKIVMQDVFLRDK